MKEKKQSLSPIEKIEQILKLDKVQNVLDNEEKNKVEESLAELKKGEEIKQIEEEYIKSIENSESWERTHKAVYDIKTNKGYIVDLTFTDEDKLARKKIKIRTDDPQYRHITPVTLVERIFNNAIKLGTPINDILWILQSKIEVFKPCITEEEGQCVQDIFEFFKNPKYQTPSGISILIKLIAHFYNTTELLNLTDNYIKIPYKTQDCYLIVPPSSDKGLNIHGGEGSFVKALCKNLDKMEKQIESYQLLNFTEEEMEYLKNLKLDEENKLFEEIQQKIINPDKIFALSNLASEKVEYLKDLISKQKDKPFSTIQKKIREIQDYKLVPFNEEEVNSFNSILRPYHKNEKKIRDKLLLRNDLHLTDIQLLNDILSSLKNDSEAKNISYKLKGIMKAKRLTEIQKNQMIYTIFALFDYLPLPKVLNSLKDDFDPKKDRYEKEPSDRLFQVAATHLHFFFEAYPNLASLYKKEIFDGFLKYVSNGVSSKDLCNLFDDTKGKDDLVELTSELTFPTQNKLNEVGLPEEYLCDNFTNKGVVYGFARQYPKDTWSIYLMDKFPGKKLLNEYKNSYIFVAKGKELKYVTSKGKYEKAYIDPKDNFLNYLASRSKKESGKKLDIKYEKIENLIGSNAKYHLQKNYFFDLLSGKVEQHLVKYSPDYFLELNPNIEQSIIATPNSVSTNNEIRELFKYYVIEFLFEKLKTNGNFKKLNFTNPDIKIEDVLDMKTFEKLFKRHVEKLVEDITLKYVRGIIKAKEKHQDNKAISEINISLIDLDDDNAFYAELKKLQKCRGGKKIVQNAMDYAYEKSKKVSDPTNRLFIMLKQEIKNLRVNSSKMESQSFKNTESPPAGMPTPIEHPLVSEDRGFSPFLGNTSVLSPFQPQKQQTVSVHGKLFGEINSSYPDTPNKKKVVSDKSSTSIQTTNKEKPDVNLLSTPDKSHKQEENIKSSSHAKISQSITSPSVPGSLVKIQILPKNTTNISQSSPAVKKRKQIDQDTPSSPPDSRHSFFSTPPSSDSSPAVKKGPKRKQIKQNAPSVKKTIKKNPRRKNKGRINRYTPSQGRWK